MTRIFGLPYAQHVDVPQGTAVVADFRNKTKLVYRAGIEIEVSNSHADFFTQGILAVRAQFRATFVVKQPKAVCTVTGL